MVWRAVHSHHDHPVAIKIMTGEHARKPRFVESFQREVRAVARLNHPNIIRVFDYGEVTEQLADLAEGQLTPGSPYMVMELAGSTLSCIDRDQLTWPHVHTMLVHILDALAHAHARGLVHRDLKPDNVLFLSDGDRGQLKLSDFGVAYAMNTTRQLRAEDDIITGTPKFMAPEQIRGHLRDQGPWTDLYALGCLIYWLTTGESMFSAGTLDELLRCHLDDHRPPLDPDLRVPEGFAEWTRRLVARHPAARFQRAADAAVALAGLTDEEPLENMTVSTSSPEGESVDVTIVEDPDVTRVWDRRDSADAEGAPSVDGLAEDSVPELPRNWRRPRHTDEPLEMLGVGLGLFELREVPLVGRHRHRDLLWSNLTDASHTRRPHVVVLQGPAGIGKTRLANWLAHRAHEVGAVSTLTARHSPIGGPADGLSRMFADRLRCTGLNREAILERVRNFYADDGGLNEDDLHQCMALTDLLASGADPEFDEDQQAIRFASPEQRYVVWKRLLVKLARRRPLLMVLDDVHWGTSTLEFVRFLIEQPADEPLPVLMVMTLRPELADDDPLASELLSQIDNRPLVDRLHVDPLPEPHHRELVEKLLNLEPTLARRVAARTAGNPLFAIQLVGDWVDEGLLEFGEKGFRLATDERPPLPEDVQGLLRRRVEHIVGQSLDAPANPALVSLELAAVLGGDVDLREWETICECAGITPPDHLLRALSAQSLAYVEQHGWSFAHGALRETLEQLAAEHGRLKRHHHHCVQMLHRLYDTSQPALAPRLARHLLAAGDDESALDYLVEAIEHHYRLGDYEQSERFFELHRSACDRMGLPEHNPRRLKGALAMVQVCLSHWDANRAEQLLDHCENACRTSGRPDLLARVKWHRCELARKKTRLDEAIELGEAALDQFRADGDSELIFHCLMSLGRAYQRKSDTGTVLQLCNQAEPHARRLDDRYFLAATYAWRGVALYGLGDYEKARECHHRALMISEQEGFVTMASKSHNNVGETYRRCDQFQQAEHHYRQALELVRRIGTGGGHTYRFNIGMVRIQQGNFDGAVEQIQATMQEARNAGDDYRVGLAHAALAACMAAAGRWERYDHHFEMARELIEASHAASDLAQTLQIAGEQALAHNALSRARTAWRIAADQWEKIGDTDRATELDAKLQSLTADHT